MNLRTPYDLTRNLVADVLCQWFLLTGKTIAGPFRQLEGSCWIAEMDEAVSLNPRDVVLAEGGIRLSGSESALGVIKQIGYGAYRFHKNLIYFSTSDNSDPNQNGREYRLVRNPMNVFRNSIAVNRRPGKMTIAQFEERVEYATGVLPIIDRYERVTGTTLDGKNVLEVGPGPDYVWTMVMACLGAKCSVVDPFVPVWSDDYHPQFFEMLAQRLQSLPRIVSISPIQRLLAERDFERAGVLTRYDVAVEEMNAPNETFDFVLSVAVAEHFYDIAAAFRELARMTRPGGHGIHIIDLRDHRDFSRPLEYLLMNEPDFLKEFVLRHAECGNRHRAQEFVDVFDNVGFETISCEPTSQFDQKYLDDLIPRLRNSGHDRYRNYSEAQLQPPGIDVLLRKK